jgi:hypothetical protein
MARSKSSLVVLDPRGQPSGIFGQSLTPDSGPNIQDPYTQPTGQVRPVHMAPRSGSLQGRTVYLVETGFAGAWDFMQEVHDWFSLNMPSVKTELRRKQGGMFTNDPALWDEIKAKGAVAILGVGG